MRRWLICRLATGAESVTLPAPNHGRFLLRLEPRFGGVFSFVREAPGVVTLTDRSVIPGRELSSRGSCALAYFCPWVGLLVAIGNSRDRILVRLLVELLLLLLRGLLLLGLPLWLRRALPANAPLGISRHRQCRDDRCDREGSHFSVLRQQDLCTDTSTGIAAAPKRATPSLKRGQGRWKEALRNR